jgi:hypothetical protein
VAEVAAVVAPADIELLLRFRFHRDHQLLSLLVPAEQEGPQSLDLEVSRAALPFSDLLHQLVVVAVELVLLAPMAVLAVVVVAAKELLLVAMVMFQVQLHLKETMVEHRHKQQTIQVEAVAHQLQEEFHQHHQEQEEMDRQHLFRVQV